METGARWAVDLLIVDQGAWPTLVEVKRGASSDLRRKVIGQMLEYAAHAAHAAHTWTADELRKSFQTTASSRQQNPKGLLEELLSEEEQFDPDFFWEDVATNLAAGRLRLLFVADDLPDPLERVVEFLNAQMPDIEVLAVEIKRFGDGTNNTFVPRVLGRTAKPQAQRTNRLTRGTFLAQFSNTEHEHVAARLLET